MNWTEVKVITETEAVEAISNILMEAGASGVAIEDAQDLVNYVEDRFGEYINKEEIEHIRQGAQVIAYFPETIFLPEVLPIIKEQVAKLPEYGLNIGLGEVSTHEVAEKNWEKAWKKYYHPIQVSRFLTIVPEWETYEPKHADERIIYMDPGMAFGTGTHPTTFLTLHALESYLRGGETLLDVGTGSGILSIAAKHFGASDVYAYDLDEVAVASAQQNIDLNPVAKDVKIAPNDLLKGIDIMADVIVANILPHIILLMIEDAWALLPEGGKFIVSGIITEKEPTIMEKMNEVGFQLVQKFQQQDWLALVFEKPVKDEE
ncbi:50S ribosomal protein L11 methyltransferase [Vagococcus xieshaowenii]|uniref:Ribosomal protein L11 methyltransferase n=1 Tax=Vagococcus xieshaowenii TaxID=2562451 RepID=A0AAJ5JLQ8_9ENTE|nr:50S ribosomal protein L11 methyltransferase [Vagococcus xieshaowenii]QCA29218.1 50S ribosomal protein L11 methyltransferase [Vagococcus xieshaowenii]TFZ43269.1 50S ribosomal protein L11 methyltransferase [Vagococcus xieshaowenii]